MNIKIFICLALTWCLHPARAQFSSDVWHDGFLVTNKEDTLRGKIKYDMENNSVQFYNKRIVRTFSGFQVVYFNIFDALSSNYRQFYSIPYSLSTDYETPIFFELLLEGRLSLLARESIVQELVPTGAGLYSGNIITPRLTRTFYFVNKKGKMTDYNGKRSSLYAIMRDKLTKVKAFIKQNKLRTNTAGDLVRITAFYNSI